MKNGLVIADSGPIFSLALIDKLDLDNDTKKDIIIKLTASIDSSVNDKHDFSSCFGAWDDSRTADEIIKEIREARVEVRVSI